MPREVLREMIRKGLVDFKPTTGTSGKKLPYYINLRKLGSHPELSKRVTLLLAEALKEVPHYDHVIGVPLAGTPMATNLSTHMGKPLLLLRERTKEHGPNAGKWVEGEFRKGDEVLVVDDALTSGKSLLDAIRKIESEGLRVKHVVVLADRGEGGREAVEAAGYKVHAPIVMPQHIAWLLAEGLITKGKHGEIRDAIKGNA